MWYDSPGGPARSHRPSFAETLAVAFLAGVPRARPREVAHGVRLLGSTRGGGVRAANKQFTLRHTPFARERYTGNVAILSMAHEGQVGHEDEEQRPAALQQVQDTQFGAPGRTDPHAHTAMSSAPRTSAQNCTGPYSGNLSPCGCCRASGPCRSGSAHVPMTLHY